MISNLEEKFSTAVQILKKNQKKQLMVQIKDAGDRVVAPWLEACSVIAGVQFLPPMSDSSVYNYL